MTAGTGTLEQAVASVPEGASVYLGNFGSQLFAVAHELIRQRRSGLHVIASTGGILLDQLIAEGVVATVTTSHCWNPIGPVKTVHFQRAYLDKSVAVRELSFGALCSGLHAAAQDLPFATTTPLAATDYQDRSGGLLDTIDTPFGPATIVAAIRPEVSFLHVDCVDDDGNGWLRQPGADVLLAAQASQRTVLVAEERGSRQQLPTIPALLVDTTVIAPGAVWPDGASGRYPRNLAAYAGYSAGAGSAEGRAAWREEVDRHG